MSDDTRDLTQRIRDALRGDEDEGNLPARISHWLSLPTLDAETDLAFTADMLGEAEYDLLALYRLLRAALARIEADAATIAALRKRVEQFETYANTLGRIIDPYDATTFTPGNQIRLYDFYDAPKEWRDLSTHGGDEDFLIYIPQAQRESYLADKLKTEGSLGRWFVSEQELPDGALIVIHAHA